ncbi:hypothetical protein HZS_7284 [Henneguya salminicola]|nr:hypothetical protein HZS_7284 [Henneguya salminicola]
MLKNFKCGFKKYYICIVKGVQPRTARINIHLTPTPHTISHSEYISSFKAEKPSKNSLKNQEINLRTLPTRNSINSILTAIKIKKKRLTFFRRYESTEIYGNYF